MIGKMVEFMLQLLAANMDYTSTIYTLQPWVYRGGGSGGGSSGNGIFRFDRESGIKDTYATFRTILTAS